MNERSGQPHIPVAFLEVGILPYGVYSSSVNF